jgi:hypothetical protein
MYYLFTQYLKDAFKKTTRVYYMPEYLSDRTAVEDFAKQVLVCTCDNEKDEEIFKAIFAGRDYINENIRNIQAQIPYLRRIEWQSGDYSAITIPKNSLIYCDPPYKDTTAYSTSRGFDYPLFYDWCRSKSKEGHTVFVSEYSMPLDFKPIWSKSVTVSVGNTTYHPTETLYSI